MKPIRSGRKKGTPNKNTLPLLQMARKLGVHPFEVLLLFAKGDWESLGYAQEENTSSIISPELRVKAASQACQYLYPKRKAIEFKDKTKKRKTGLENYTDEQLTEIARKYAEFDRENELKASRPNRGASAS